MRIKSILAALLLMVAGLQTADAQGFRVYMSDGTEIQFSLKTDSIVFDNGLSGDEVFGPFTPVNLCIAKTWYKSKSERVTFGADGTTDYVEGGTYKFFPYQGNIIVYNASGAPVNILRVYEVTGEKMIVGTAGDSQFKVWATTVQPQLVEEIVLSETSLKLQLDNVKTLTATVLPEDADNKDVAWESSDDNVAEVNARGRVTANGDGNCVITCRATDGSGVFATCEVTVGNSGSQIGEHEYVEIGGLKWATMNVGATTVAGSYETCFGDYFAWGETEPRYSSITRTSAYEATFAWKDGYLQGYPIHDARDYWGWGETLDAAHDAATANWGSTWRTPTKENFKALAIACSGSYEDQTPITLSAKVTSGGVYWLTAEQTYESDFTGVAGLLFVSASDISKRIFFPAAGRVVDDELEEDNNYWSSTKGNDNSKISYTIYFSDKNVWFLVGSYRSLGFPVRPVSD